MSLPPGGDTHERDDRLRNAIDHPKSHLRGSVCRASAGSPFAIEILVKGSGDYAPRSPKDEKGLAYIPIERNEKYAIRIVNDAPFDAATTLTIHGISMFAFSDIRNKQGKPEYTQLIIPARSSAIVHGWHRDNAKSEEFVVTEYAKSAAAELRNTSNLGVITVTFAAAWAPGQPPPSDEPATPPSEFIRSANATGRGQVVEAGYETVEREFGVTRAAVTVRYTK